MSAQNLALLAAVGIPVVLLGLAVWRVQWKKHVRRRFEAYRERVMHLSDTLDALQERHKLLPFTDPDFATPMAGQTEALYRTAHESMEEFRRRWLNLMDAWEKSQALLEQEPWWSARRFRQAEQLLRAAGVEQELEGLHKRCAEPLDRLEQGHEQAQTELTAADGRMQRLAARLEEVAHANMPSEPYQPERTAIQNLVEQSRGVAHNDPIGALDGLAQARERAEAWEQWIDTILHLRRKADEAQGRLDAAAATLKRRRAEGFLFCEAGCDPQPRLDEGARHRQTALDALNRADATAAKHCIGQAFQAADDATGLVDQTVNAKALCHEAMTRRSDETRRHHEQLRAARQIQFELEREFAPESWREVAGHVASGQSLLNQVDATLDEAASLAGPQVQHYCRAASLVEQAAQQQRQLQTLFAGVEQRWNELVDLRRRCREELNALQRRADGLADTLRRGNADRTRTNDRCREAFHRLAELHREAERPRADWPQLEPRLKEIAQALTDAERMAQEDARLAQQAADALAAAQRQIEQAQNFSRLGISADLSVSRRSRDEAERGLQRQEYEEALRLARQAEHEAHQALAQAERRANEEQAQLDQVQRVQNTPVATLSNASGNPNAYLQDPNNA